MITLGRARPTVAARPCDRVRSVEATLKIPPGPGLASACVSSAYAAGTGSDVDG